MKHFSILTNLKVKRGDEYLQSIYILEKRGDEYLQTL